MSILKEGSLGESDNTHPRLLPPSDLPKSMWKLVCNPIYVVTCLGACMELMIVSGFIVFLPKYLETQFSLSKSQASVFAGQY